MLVEPPQPAFLDHVREVGAQLCINGDGFDILQSSFSGLVGGSLPVLRKLRALHRQGTRIYYVIGNHDIAFEHLIADLPIVVGEYPHHVAAQALFSRGFDAVVFGHTHHPELTRFDSGTFVNAGSWLAEGNWVDVHNGEITLRTWNGPGASH